MTNMTMVMNGDNNKSAIDFYNDSGWAKRRNITLCNIHFQGYGGTAINFEHGDELSTIFFENITIDGCKFVKCRHTINARISVNNLSFINK